MLRYFAVIAALLMTLDAAAARAVPGALKPGDRFEIRRSVERRGITNDGSKSSSTDRYSIVEAVLAVGEDGVTIEYDLSGDTPSADRARQWEYPFTVVQTLDRPPQLQNVATLNDRVDTWLRSADLTRSDCGRWYFTWNAFQVDCEALSVLKLLELFDLGGTRLEDGAMYRDPRATAPAQIRRDQAGSKTTIFVAELIIDETVFRQERAQADVTVGVLMRKPVTLEAALSARSAEAIAGVIRVTLEPDAAGYPWRRTTVTTTTIRGPKDRVEQQISTEVVERRRLPRS